MKKLIYIILAVVLGFLLSFLVHAGLEMGYISYAAERGIILTPYLGGACFLPPWLSIGLVIAGIAGGLVLGFWWWDVIYVKKRRGRQ